MKRKNDILKLLFSEKRYFSVSEIANQIGFSEKTVRNELKDIEKIVQDFNIEIVKKPGQGIMVNGELADYQEFLGSDLFKSRKQMSPTDRQKDILSQLILNNDSLLIKQLELDYHVGHSTINKDIQIINDTLEDFDLSINYHKGEGVYIEGSEEEKRRLLAFLTSVNNEEIYETHNEIYSSQFLDRFRESLNIDFKKVENIVKEAEKALGYHLSSEAMVNLIIHIAIAIRRMQQGNSVVLSKDLVEKLKGQKEFKIAESTSHKIEIEFDVRFSDEEKYYILLHFLCAKRLKEDIGLIDFKLKSDDAILENSVLKMIRNVQVELGVFLENDVHLFNSLMLHLKPAIHRLEYGLTIQNPLFDDIQNDYGELCQILQKNINIFKQVFNAQIPAHEIAYLALHFAAALERNYKPIRTVVMCASGLGTAQLLVAKLKRNFANLEIIDVVSNLEVNKYTNKEADLIISTINVNSALPVITVSPLLTTKDLDHVRTIVENTNYATEFSFLNPSNIHINRDFESKQEILEYLNKVLLEQKYVTEGFLEGLIERENLGSTVVAPYIGLPHAMNDSIKFSSIQIITLKKPILWDESNYVRFILSVNINKDDSERYINFFKRLAEIEYESHFWDELMKIKDKENFSIKFNKMFSDS